MKRTDKELLERDSKRDLGSELLDSVREMMAARRSREHQVNVPEAAVAPTVSHYAGSIRVAALPADADETCNTPVVRAVRY